SYGNGIFAKLAWFDLEAKSSGLGQAFGYLATDGDNRGAIMPAFSHDGKSIVYISTTDSDAGHPTDGQADIYMIPYGDRKGGAASPVPGAADPAYNEYYPAFSPDDQLIAFNRIDKGKDTYNQPDAEVFVIPAQGGKPTRLTANDPIACSGEASPALTTPWPKWPPH